MNVCHVTAGALSTMKVNKDLLQQPSARKVSSRNSNRLGQPSAREKALSTRRQDFGNNLTVQSNRKVEFGSDPPLSSRRLGSTIEEALKPAQSPKKKKGGGEMQMIS